MSNFLKKYVIGALCTVVTLSASTALCLVAPKHASAETTQPAKMEMLAGASARLEDEGLRFIVQMDNATKVKIVSNDSITLELWIMPSAAWKSQKDTTNYADWTKAVVNVDESKIYQLEEATGETKPWYANGVLRGIHDLGYNKMDMVCVPVKVDGSGATPAYTLETSGVEDTEMSLYDVLNCAVLDNTGMNNTGMSVEAIENVLKTYSWFGSNDYPIELKDRAAYDALIENVNRGVDFSGKVAVNTGKTTPTKTVDSEKVGLMPTVETYYSVSFYEADGETLIKSVSVKQGEGISAETLASIVPATIENKEFDGWSEVTNVTADKNITATYTNVWTVTFYDVDGTALGNRKVKNNGYLTEADLEINVSVDADSRFNGWALTADGEVVSDLTQIPVTENVSYYPVLEQKVAVQVTVMVEDYSAERFSKDSVGEKAKRFAYLDNGNGHADVMGAYIGDKKYTDKTTEFKALLANVNLKGFVGDKVSLDSFKTSLPNVYRWVAENDGDITIVEGETPQITVKLDANEEVLGFSLLDVYTVYNWSNQSAIFRGLTLLEDGTAGVLITNEGFSGASQSICLRTDAVAVADYRAIRLNFKYKAENYLRINLNDGGWADGVYRDPVKDWSNQSVELKSVAASEKNPEDTVRVVKLISMNGSTNKPADFEILLTGLSYLKISTTENTTLSAKEVNILAQPKSGNGSVALTTDENGVQVVRFTSEKDAACSWPGRGFAIDLSGITDATYASVIVKFKVRNAEAFGRGNIRVGVNSGNAEAFVPVATTEQIDLMNLGIDGDAYVNIKANGLGSVWICLPEILCKNNDVVIDIYSIEFVVNTSAAE